MINWQENGGSPLGNGAAQGDADRKHAGHGGYGSSVIRDLIPYELKGSTVDLDLATSGVRCHIEIPLTALAMAESDPERDVPRGDSVVGWNCSAANKSVAEQISGAEQVSGLAKGSTQR